MKGPKFHATLANRAGVATTMAVCVEVDPEGWNGYADRNAEARSRPA